MTHGPLILEGKGIANQIDGPPPQHICCPYICRYMHAQNPSLSDGASRVSFWEQYFLKSKGTMQKSY
jgi:hypothetical protein